MASASARSVSICGLVQKRPYARRIPAAHVRLLTETLRLVGDLELHGVKVEERVELTATFGLRSGALAGITLGTPEPLPLKLSAYGLPGSAADSARVTFEISAAIAP